MKRPLGRNVLAAAFASTFAVAPAVLAAQARTAVLQRAESAYLALRDLKDQIDVTVGRGVDTSVHGVPLGELARQYRSTRPRLVRALVEAGRRPLAAADRRATDVMLATFGRELVESPMHERTRDTSATPCDISTTSAATPTADREALAARLYACFGVAARYVTVGDTVLDRLGILGLLAREPDAVRRRDLFLALRPMWRTVVGDGGAESP